MCSVALAVATAFAAEIVTSNPPTTVGVPEIAPVVVFTDKPAGSGVASNDDARVAVIA
jgi:hypothetical protein